VTESEDGKRGKRDSDSKRVAATPAIAAGLVATADESLLDVIDNLLNRGVLLHGELVLGLADVDLVYARLSLLLCAADRVLPPRENRPPD
jgi:hypothetical protein